MIEYVPSIVVVVIIFFALVVPTYFKLKRREREARMIQAESAAAGRNEPATIRPWIDPQRCLGSAACVAACPEDVLAIIHGQAVIVNGAACIGHGACARACPVEAIELVFGSERTGIEIPDVAPDFMTNVPGLYVAGELGGMGLIANAVEQGKQAMDNALRNLPPTPNEGVDVVIIGAGPAGLGAGLRALERGVSYALLEQDEFGGAIRHYPRQKIVMTRPVDLPGHGKVKLSTVSKEDLITLFEGVVEKTGLQIRTGVRVDSVLPTPEGFCVEAGDLELFSSRVVLAVGRRGTPRKLEVPGEDLEKVAYRLIDPEKYQFQHLLVVGGGDSALEAACSLAEQDGNRVTLSYRNKEINRPKPANLARLRAGEAAGTIRLLLGSTVTRIELDRVELQHDGHPVVLPNDFVFVLAGGILPKKLLAEAGIRVQRHHGKKVVAVHA